MLFVGDDDEAVRFIFCFRCLIGGLSFKVNKSHRSDTKRRLRNENLIDSVAWYCFKAFGERYRSQKSFSRRLRRLRRNEYFRRFCCSVIFNKINDYNFTKTKYTIFHTKAFLSSQQFELCCDFSLEAYTTCIYSIQNATNNLFRVAAPLAVPTLGGFFLKSQISLRIYLYITQQTRNSEVQFFSSCTSLLLSSSK